MTTALKQALDKMSDSEFLSAAKLIRKLHRQAVASGRVQLEPTRMRKLDADIAELERNVNYGG